MPKPTIEEMTKAFTAHLDSAFLDMLRLEKRYAFVEAFLNELHAQTHGEKFDVKTDLIWQWFWDAYESTVVHMAAYTKRAYRPGGGGVLKQVPNYLPILQPGVLPPPVPGGVIVEDLSGKLDVDALERETQAGIVRDAEVALETRFQRLFPLRAAGDPVRPSDVQDLEERFMASIAIGGLHEERHAIAHRYESRIDKLELSADLKPLRLAFDHLEEILSDLRFLTVGYGFTFDIARNLDRTVRDLVDQMLIGDVNRLVGVVGMSLDNGLYWQLREGRGERLSE